MSTQKILQTYTGTTNKRYPTVPVTRPLCCTVRDSELNIMKAQCHQMARCS